MADYTRMQLRLVQSGASDYSDPTHDTGNVEIEANSAYVKQGKLTIGTAGALTLYAANEWSTIDFLLIQNLDDTNFVSAIWTYADGAQASPEILAGKVLLSQNVKVTGTVTLQADTSACDVYYWMSGT